MRPDISDDLTQALMSMTDQLRLKFGLESCGFASIALTGEVLQASDPNFALPLEQILESWTDEPWSLSAWGLRWLMIPCDTKLLVFAIRETAESQSHSVEQLSQEVAALRRIGRALNMNHTIHPLGLAAVHAIKGALGLKSASIYLRQEDGTESLLSLTGESVFGNREGEQTVSLPLSTAERTVGRLEMTAYAQDSLFAGNGRLHRTIAEHLAFAIMAAQAFEIAERMATTDSLTGIANHRTLHEYLNSEISSAEVRLNPLVAVMVDVDLFRNFNETEGHDAGDRVLKLVAHALQTSVGDQGLAARYGGEEFALVLSNCPVKEAFEIANRALANIREIVYLGKDGARKIITASFGLASYPESGKTPESLLKAADEALYLAKSMGRNRVVLHQSIDRAA